MNSRGQFSSRIGFVLAAAGSAVGLGNIWAFPTQVASNGGAAFVLIYIVLAFLLAYPVLMAEFTIGRATGANMVDALEDITGIKSTRLIGVWGFITVSLILSFYSLVGGWMIAYCLQNLVKLTGVVQLADWLGGNAISRNLIMCGLFMFLTAKIVSGGVSEGIERWSKRLMPTLFGIIVLLIAYVATLDGAWEGWKAYLLPDFSSALNPNLMIDAMGQAFFSMSLGVGTMLVYGSYVSKKENLLMIGASVALVDIGVAFLAGLLIIPAMYVALNNGVEIYSESGQLLSEDTLIFAVLPSLFDTMGSAGVFVGFAFFLLMTVAALTSSISMLEVPVAYVVESKGMDRKRAVWGLGGLIYLISGLIIFNFSTLFGFIITITTKYSQPLLGLILCLVAGWLWKRADKLEELKQGNEGVESSLFWKVWPWYIRTICPAIILFMFVRSL